MEGKYANFCKDILYEIRHNGPLEKIRREWSALQNRCVFQNTSEMEKTSSEICICGKNSRNPINECVGYPDNPRLILTDNKMTVEITHAADKETITNYIKSGIFNFGIDLFFGSVHQNLDALVRLQKVALKESESLGFSIPLSIYLKLSPRTQYTGKLTKNRSSISLKLHTRVVITSDRKYASYCCHRIIYVNARFLIFDLEKCDIILLGDNVELQVVETGMVYVVCAVIVPGNVTCRMPVKFPSKFEWALTRVSAEELEDLTFAIGTDINVIVSCKPGCIDFSSQLRQTLIAFKCENIYLFTSLRLSYLESLKNAQWIAETYDGFIVDCSREQTKNNVIKLTPGARLFMENAFSRKKPIFLTGSWSIFVHCSDYEYAFYYPDKYVMPCNNDFLHLFEAVFNKLAPSKCISKKFHDKSITGSTVIARSIAAASYDFQADVIVMCAISGQMAIKVAHFRPRVPIIAVTSIKSVVNYTLMHHNIWMLLFDANNDKEISHKKDTHQKLVYGVRYAIHKNLLDCNSLIILVYRKLLRYGYTDKFIVIKFDEKYVETIKNAILQK